MKTYTGSPSAARNYVEADRGRADDYYLTEGTGVAQRYVASPEAGVRRLAPLSGDAYEAWVAGVDPDTGAPKGRLRNDAKAVRFVEVTVNGPKSWSLAAELHPDIGAAYDAAQDRAAEQIIGWLAQHSTTRVGPRGAQVQVPVAEIEAVTVRHYTSRAGDPHRHLHLQINSRVFTEGTWRGLHTIGVRDSLDAINGIGHAAVMTDPAFRESLAAHGFTLTSDGEIAQLASFVGPFSARAAQIERNIARYESAWRAANPGREPGVAQLRSWDARAWADGRPDKVTPVPGVDIHHRWLGELARLGYRDPDTLFDVVPARVGVRVGELDRGQAVEQVLARLAKRRSGWNAADIRGDVEQLIARDNIVTDAAIRTELAGDLTVRTLAECVPILDRLGVPEHIRALSSRHVLDVEGDLAGRFAARTGVPKTRITVVEPVVSEHLDGLDAGQRTAVNLLAGDRELVVIEGAAGAGKTTTLSATRAALEYQGHRLTVVTPTLKAAKIAADQVGTRAGSAAWLAYQHGFRWDEHGTWTRINLGEVDPHTGAQHAGPSASAALHRGDLLLVDEAGMLDQDTARALLTVADEHHARVALVGDRHQLSAVGRGGVLDLAARWAAPDACLTLDTVHRFTRTVTAADGAIVTTPDEDYAQLSLQMRSGEDPGEVFDALLARGQIRVHGDAAGRIDAIADHAATTLDSRPGAAMLVLADTREQVADLNAAIRERLVATGRVDDAHTATTMAGQCIGVGDKVATRRNNSDLDVANRDTWTVTHIAQDGHLTLAGEHGDRTLPPGYVREHVELGYASTVHSAQGDTSTTAHLALGEYTGAASAYVGMTRGRTANTAHLVAVDLDEAREQWVGEFARDRADLGPAHAAELAAQEASRYAQHRPVEEVLTELHRAWSVQDDCLTRLAGVEQRRDLLADVVTLTRERDATVPALKQAYQDARVTAEQATGRAGLLDGVVSARTSAITDALHRDWDAQRSQARHAAQIVRDGPGRLGHRVLAVNRATEQLAHWSTTWQPYLPAMPTRSHDIAAFAAWFEDTPRLHDAFATYARTLAEHDQPEYLAARAAADAATQHRDQASRAWRDASGLYSLHLSHYGSLAHHNDPAGALAETEQTITAAHTRLDTAQARAAALLAEPTLRALPADRISTERDLWSGERDTQTRQRHARSGQRDADRLTHQHTHDHDIPMSQATPDHSPGISR